MDGLTDDLTVTDEGIQSANALLTPLGLEVEAIPPNTSRQDAIRLIDDKIVQLPQHSLSTLRSARNAFAPISMLPIETMTKIFQSIAQPDDRGDFGNATWREFSTILQVCSAWRKIVQQCPSLWSRPIFSPKAVGRIFVEMKKRSKTIPLSIRVSPKLGVDIDSMEHIGRSWRGRPRIWPFLSPECLGELHVSILDPSSLNNFFHINYSQSTAPDLRSIIVGTPVGTVVQIIGAMPPEYNRSLDILRIPLPRLELLDLTYCKVPWDLMDMRVWEQLTTVKLRRISEPPMGLPSKQFYNFLAKAPNLEVLELHTSLPEVSGKRRKVILSALVSCVVDGSSPVQCVDFQQCIEYPDTTRVVIVPS